MIYVIADTHGDTEVLANKLIKHLKEEDHLIIAGDFGFLWENTEKEHKVIRKLGMKKHTTIFIPGENDNISLYKELAAEDAFGGRAANLFGNLWMAFPGIFEIEGKKLLLCGEPADDAQESMINELFRSDETKALQLDAVITFEPPVSLGGFVMGEYEAGKLGYLFDSVKTEIDFKKWYFGKLHKNMMISQKYCAVFDEPHQV